MLSKSDIEEILLDHVSVLAIGAGLLFSLIMLVCLCTSNCTYGCCLFLISIVFFLNLYHDVAFLLRIKMYILPTPTRLRVCLQYIFVYHQLRDNSKSRPRISKNFFKAWDV